MKVNGVLALWIGLNVISHSVGAELSEGSLKPGVPNPPSVAFELPDGTLPLGYNYLPAVMQALAYYSDMLQYEQLATTTIEPPIGDQYVTSGIVQGDPVTTKKPNVSTPKPTTKPPPQRTTTRATTPRSTTRTTQKPTTRTTQSTSRRPPTTTISYPYSTVYNIWYNPEATTPAHKPGYFSPQKPPKPQKPIINIKPKPPGSTQKPVYVKPKPSTTTQRPSLVTKRTTNPHRPTSTTYRPTERPAKPEQSYQKPSQKPGTVNDPSWQDQSFVDWFFQAKPQKNEPFDENELQNLDSLPRQLLLDITNEKSFLPALLDHDNVKEFRKVYDDAYERRYKFHPNTSQMKVQMLIQKLQQRVMSTGHKKSPATKPYVDAMILYDLLKREAKTLGLANFGGYDKRQLYELAESSKHSADNQLHYLLKQMLDRKDCKRRDAVSRAETMLKELENSNSAISISLRYIPPLVFLP